MLIQYIQKRFRPKTLALIEQANEIIQEYADAGYDLTLRQLYYQFVARALIPNTERSYKMLGKAISDGRLAGLVSWAAIEDRTRNLQGNSHWSSPCEFAFATADQFRIDLWADQPRRVEVWVEKEALAGVFAQVCQEEDVALFPCRGYVSQSEQWRAGIRFARRDQPTLVLHFGDHDPSGIDMTRDNLDRLTMFSEGNVEVKRVALNYDQVEQYNPPPNPAKTTDARFEDYRVEHGDESWELDALEPRVLAELVREHVGRERDDAAWAESVARQEDQRGLLHAAEERWDEIEDLLRHG